MSIFRAFAKFAVETALKGAGGKIATTVVFDMLLGQDGRMDAALIKLDELLKGQKQLETMIKSLPAELTLRTELSKLHTHVAGLLSAVNTGAPSKGELKDLNRFLDFTGPTSCRAFADTLAQEFFGLGNVTPESIWTGSGETPAGKLGQSAYIPVRVRAIADEVRTLEGFMGQMATFFRQVVSYYAYLAAAMIAIHRYLADHQKFEMAKERRMNPELLKAPGLAGAMANLTALYMEQAWPEVFILHQRVFEAREAQRIVLLTNKGLRILECDDSKGRAPIETANSVLDLHQYKIEKIVYADHTAINYGNPNHAWEIEPAESAPSPYCVIRSCRGAGKYLGWYPYLSASRRNTTYGQIKHQSDELGVRDAKSDHRAHWQIYVHRNIYTGVASFMFVNRHTNTTLNITADSSWKSRQAFLEGEPKDTEPQGFQIRMA